MGVLEGEGGKNSEPRLEPDSEASRVLVEVSRQHSIVEVLRDEFLLLLKSLAVGRTFLIRHLVHL